MPTVEMSSQLGADVHQRLFFGNPSTTYYTNNSAAANQRMIYMIPLLPSGYYQNVTYPNTSYNYNGQIDICKGTVPTDFSTLTAYNSRSADVLVTVKSSYSDTRFLSGSASSATEVSLTSILTNATASGTATWYILRTYGPTADGAVALYHQIVGTVGAVGSGSDLEISSTNIVSGNAYRIINLRFQIPTSYTY